MTKRRALTGDEERQKNIMKLFHEQRLNERFNWFKLIGYVFLEILCVLVICYFDKYWFSWLAKCTVGIIPIIIWGLIIEFRDNRKESISLHRIINEIETTGYVSVIEYTCQKAIQFSEFEDEGDCYAMEVGEDELLFWYDRAYLESGLLPCSKFEVYANESDILCLFGKRINIIGNKIQPIVIRSEIKKNIYGELPEHLEIIPSSVGSFLADLENKYNA